MSRGKTYSAAELAEVADGLRRLLARIEAGEISASGGTANRIEGAVAALEALAEGGTWQPIVPR
jgi:hypothetical protein